MNPNAVRIVLAIAALFGPFQEPTVTSLIQQLQGPPAAAREAAESLGKIWGQDFRTGENTRGRELRPYEKELIEILNSSNSREVRRILSGLLYNMDTPTARAAWAADYKRGQEEEAKIQEARKLRESTPLTIEQVTAVLHRSLDPDPIYDLKTSSSWNLLPDDPSLFVTLHQNDRKDQLLEIWQRSGNQYRFQKSLSAEGGANSLFDYKVFKFGKETFYVVLDGLDGTGMITEPHVYHVDRVAHTLQDVEIRISVEDFELLPGESIRRGPFITFDDDKIDYGFAIRSPIEGKGGVGSDCIIEKDVMGNWILRVKR